MVKGCNIFFFFFALTNPILSFFFYSQTLLYPSSLFFSLVFSLVCDRTHARACVHARAHTHTVSDNLETWSNVNLSLNLAKIYI